jgi:hypothetical protein
MAAEPHIGDGTGDGVNKDRQTREVIAKTRKVELVRVPSPKNPKGYGYVIEIGGVETKVGQMPYLDAYFAYLQAIGWVDPANKPERVKR